MKKNKVKVDIPKGMVCFKKIGGGSFSFPNRIIKPNQKFWAFPNSVPDAFKDQVQEVEADKTAVILSGVGSAPIAVKEEEVVETKFEVVSAVNEDGEPLRKGKKLLYIVADLTGKVISEEPMLKGKANKLAETLNQ